MLWSLNSRKQAKALRKEPVAQIKISGYLVLWLVNLNSTDPSFGNSYEGITFRGIDDFSVFNAQKQPIVIDNIHGQFACVGDKEFSLDLNINGLDPDFAKLPGDPVCRCAGGLFQDLNIIYVFLIDNKIRIFFYRLIGTRILYLQKDLAAV